MKTLDFARKYLFDPLEIVDIDWKKSPKDIELGYAGMWLKPHDIAKLGQLYLNNGRWGNKQIVPSEWIEVSTGGHVDTKSVQYGYHWWVAKTARRFPWLGSKSVRSYEAVGSNGQRISVLPEKKIVVVFTGSMKGKEGAHLVTRKLIDSYIIPAASSDKLHPDEKAQTWLDQLLKNVAKPVAYIWNSRDEGFAKDGLFKHTASPKLSLTLPVNNPTS